MAVASTGPGCAEKCFSDGAAVRISINLGSKIDGSALERLKVYVTVGQVTREDEIYLDGRLADGETSLEVALGDAAAGGFEAKIEVVALDAAGAKVAAARGQASGEAEMCVVLRLTLFREQDTDQGPRLDGGPKPDKPKPTPDIKPPPKDLPPVKKDFPPIPVDLPVVQKDFPPIPVDMPPIPPDMPPVKKDFPPIPTDMPPIPPDMAMPTPDKAAPTPDKATPKPDLPPAPDANQGD